MTNQTLDIQWQQACTGRFPDGYLEARLLKEQRKSKILIDQESRFKHQYLSARSLVPKILKISGMSSFGLKHATKINLNENRLKLTNLPNAFNGYRLLHISDPHFNGNSERVDNLVQAIGTTEYDLCVLTGDYRYRSFGPIEVAVEGLEQLQSCIDSKIISILGNHDSLTMVPVMESLGMQVLLNENVTIHKQGSSIHFVGVDDPSYYKTHDLALAMTTNSDIKMISRELSDAQSSSISNDLSSESFCTILLAHSPELINEANNSGVDGYLCGHTHGGQICLPGGVAVLKERSLPRWCVAGSWQHESMAGYTSVGVGVSVVDARFFCPPEITVHTLVSS